MHFEFPQSNSSPASRYLSAPGLSAPGLSRSFSTPVLPQRLIPDTNDKSGLHGTLSPSFVGPEVSHNDTLGPFTAPGTPAIDSSATFQPMLYYDDEDDASIHLPSRALSASLHEQEMRLHFLNSGLVDGM